MAKGTIVFEDIDDNPFSMNVEFFPALEKGISLTLAQKAGLAFADDAGDLIEQSLDGKDSEGTD